MQIILSFLINLLILIFGLFAWLYWVFFAVHHLLIVVISLVSEHGLQDERALEAVSLGLSCPRTCGIFLTRDWTHAPCISKRILNH